MSTTVASPHSPHARPSASSCSYRTTTPSNPSCRPRPTSPTPWAPLECACSRRDPSTSRCPHHAPPRPPSSSLHHHHHAARRGHHHHRHRIDSPTPSTWQAWHLATVEPAGEGTPPTAARAERLADAATMALDLISRVKESDAFELVPCQLDPELGPAVCDPRCHPQARVCPAPSPSTQSRRCWPHTPLTRLTHRSHVHRSGSFSNRLRPTRPPSHSGSARDSRSPTGYALGCSRALTHSSVCSMRRM